MSQVETKAQASSGTSSGSASLEHRSAPDRRDSGGCEATSEERNHDWSPRIWLWIAFALLALILLILWQLQSHTISSDGMGVAGHELPPAADAVGLQTPIERSDQPIDLV